MGASLSIELEASCILQMLSQLLYRKPTVQHVAAGSEYLYDKSNNLDEVVYRCCPCAPYEIVLALHLDRHVQH